MLRLIKLTFSALVLVLAAASTAQATLPGANGRFLYTVGNPLSHLDLYSVCPDGTGDMMIASGAREGQYSPDGTKIVYSSGGGHFPNFAMVVADADGENAKTLFADFGEEDYPSWSPDGTRIAFHSRMPAYERDDETSSWGNTPYVIDLTTKTPVPLLTSNVVGVESFTEMSWSPDGARLYFVGVDHAGEQAIYWASTDGAGVATKVSGTSGAASLDVSPDGQKMVVSKYVDEQWSTETSIYDIDGGGALKLADRLVENRRAGAGFYQFSPDNTKLFFWRYGETPEGEYTPSEAHPATSNLDGSGETQLIGLPGISRWTNNTDGCDGHLTPLAPKSETPPAQAPPVDAGVVAKSTARITLATRGSIHRSKQKASIGISCADAACAGSVELTLIGRKHVKLGGAPFSIQAGSSQNTSARLSPAGVRAIKALKHWKHVKVRVEIVSAGGDSAPSLVSFVQR